MSKVMIDIETLGTEENATIVSIAAVIFAQHATSHEFYMVCDLDQHRTIDHRTVRWWLQQDAIPRAVFKDTEKRFSLVKCLQALVLFFEVNDVDEVWANSPDFDCAILADACGRLGITWPARFYQYRDVRTVKKLLPEEMRAEETNYMHNALADCYHQIADVQTMFNAMTRLGEPVETYWQDAYITDEYTIYDEAGDELRTYKSREDARAGVAAYARQQSADIDAQIGDGSEGTVGGLVGEIKDGRIKHEWVSESTPGMYDTKYTCSKCGGIYTASIDNPYSSLPVYGCGGTPETLPDGAGDDNEDDTHA